MIRLNFLRRSILAPLAAMLFWAALALPAQAVNIERVVSPGGIEAWLVREQAVPLVTIEFAFRGGSSQDPAEKSGTAYLAAGLLDEGAGPLDSKAFQEALEKDAIELSFRAGPEHLHGSLRALAGSRDKAFDLLRLALTAPRFDAPAVERIRAQVISGLQRETTDPNAISRREFWAAAFPDHPFGRIGKGTLETVPRIAAGDLKAFTARTLARDNLIVAVVGDIEATEAGAMLDKVFGALPAKADLKPIVAIAPQALGRQISFDVDVPQTVVNFGTTGIARRDPDFMAAYLVTHVLSGGTFSSRLYEEVREKRGLAYSVSGSLVWYGNATAIYAGATATRADKTAETVAIIQQEFRRMAEQGPTAEEFARAKAYVKGAYMLNLDTSTKIAGQLVQMQIDRLGIDYMQKRGAMIDAVTLEDARRVAKRLFDKGLLITLVGRPVLTAAKGG